MASFVLTALSGWLAALLLGANACSPYLIRATQGVAQERPARFRLHYTLGLLIPAFAFVHAWLPMGAGLGRQLEQTGLLLATAALVIMLFQIGCGISLRGSQGSTRRIIRRLHFWTMALLIGLVTTHIILNRA